MNSLNVFEELKEKYLILQQIDRGTYGDVYQAFPVSNNDPENEGKTVKHMLKDVDIQTIDAEHCVAIKRIKVIRSQEESKRTETVNCSEIDILFKYRHNKYFPKLHEILRDKTTGAYSIIMEFIPHMKPINYMFDLQVKQIQYYFRALFEALNALHKDNIIHRDIKFANFLCWIHPSDPTQSKYKLIDFGTAQKYPQLIGREQNRQIKMNRAAFNTKQLKGNKHFEPSLAQERLYKQGQLISCQLDSLNGVCDHNQCNPIGALKELHHVLEEKLPKSHSKAKLECHRKGTRGYRAPEILLKTDFQDGRIDVYSAGIMLVGILTGSYPFFQPECDEEHLLQMMAVYGVETILQTASRLHREINLHNWGLSQNNHFFQQCRENKINSTCDGNLSTIVEFRRKCVQDASLAKHLPIGYPARMDELMLDFLDKTTNFDFAGRYTADKALRHPFLDV